MKADARRAGPPTGARRAIRVHSAARPWRSKPRHKRFVGGLAPLPVPGRALGPS
jgi:hypothetical protein